MIKTLLFDFSRVLLHPVDETFLGSLNNLHRELSQNQDYRASNYFGLNKELMEYLLRLKSSYQLCIFTTDIIQDDPTFKKELDKIFEKIYSAGQLGISKRDPKSYEFILKDLNKKAEKVLFIDDTQGNIDAAKSIGIKTHLFTSNKELFEELNHLPGSV